MQVHEISISKIKYNQNNPRRITNDKFAKLVQSIRDFPEMLRLRPIVVNDDMIVLGGNQRLRASKRAGLKIVPIIKASDLTEDQQREFIIRDNASSGDWDWDALANEWNDVKLNDWGLDVPKFDDGSDDETDKADNQKKDTKTCPACGVEI